MTDITDDLPLFVDEEPTESRRVPIQAQQPDIVLEEAQPTQEKRKKRRQQGARPTVGQAVLPSSWAFFRTTSLAFFAAVLAATVFSYWTPEETLPDSFQAQMQIVRTTDQPFDSFPTPLPTVVVQQKIGIIAGHSGPLQDGTVAEDPGAVCDDNFDGTPELRELDINVAVARLVAEKLLLEGYNVEILGEWDSRLDDYRATALVSIHANDCRDYGGGATGFNAVGPFARGVTSGADDALVNCLRIEYEAVTGLPRHFGVTEDMTNYHTFEEISYDTPVAIIEIGFMFADRVFLTEQQDSIAEGIAAGIMCYVENFVLA